MTEAVHPKQISVSIGRYNQDGYLIEHGVFLHFGKAIVKAAETIEDFKTIVAHMAFMVNEIETHYEAMQ